MNRIAPLALVIASLPALAWGQPMDVAGSVTGVSSQPHESRTGAGWGQDPEAIRDMLSALQALQLSLDVRFQGASRTRFGSEHIAIETSWARQPGSDTPVLTGLDFRPSGDGMEFGGYKIKRAFMNSSGHLRVEIDGFFDLTITDITRTRDGGREIHVRGWPNIFIDADGKISVLFLNLGEVELPNLPDWPPSMEQILEFAQGLPESDEPGVEARIDWSASAVTDPLPLPGMDGVQPAVRVAARGSGVLESDGSFRTIGDGNEMRLELTVGDADLAALPMEGLAGRGSGRIVYSGRYGVSVPANGGFGLEVDGDFDYTIDGRNVSMRVPSGTRFHAGALAASGDGHISARFGDQESSVVLSDGTYSLRLDGAMGITGLQNDLLSAADLGLDGTVTSNGEMEYRDGDWAVSGRAAVDAGVESDGIVAALGGENTGGARIDPSSRVVAELERFEASGSSEGLDHAAAAGTVDADIHLRDGEVGLESAELDASAGTLEVDGRFDADLGGLNSASGTVTARLDREANLSWEGLPGEASVAPAPEDLAEVPTGAQTHVVIAGDSLWGIGRDYGVSVDALRRANALTSDSLTVGQVLVIPAGTVRVPRTHVVERGDSLWRIGNQYGVGVDALRRANDLTSDTLQIGQVLEIPGQFVEQPAPTQPRPQPVARPEPATPSEPGEPADPIRIDARVGAGSEMALEIDDARFGADGWALSGRLRSAITLSRGQWSSGGMRAALTGAARAALEEVAFQFSTAGDGDPRLESGRVEIPVRINLEPGTQMDVSINGEPTALTLDRPGSYAEFTVEVTFGDHPTRLHTFDEVEVLLLSEASTVIGGESVEVPGQKRLSFTGRVNFQPDGIVVYGDFNVSISGDENTPLLRIRW